MARIEGDQLASEGGVCSVRAMGYQELWGNFLSTRVELERKKVEAAQAYEQAVRLKPSLQQALAQNAETAYSGVRRNLTTLSAGPLVSADDASRYNHLVAAY